VREQVGRKGKHEAEAVACAMWLVTDWPDHGKWRGAGMSLARRSCILGAVLAAGLAMLPTRPAEPQEEGAWRVVCDFDDVTRIWMPETGPADNVRISDEQAHSGGRSLAVTLKLLEGRMVRATWQTEVGDLRWSPESRLRFWLKGSPLSQMPHGGIILVEAGGRVGGGDAHWMLPIPGETYADPNWHQWTSPPLREATNCGWAPDADGRFDPRRLSKLLFVAQEEAPPDLLKPFTIYLDDLEACDVSPLEVTYTNATVEERPRHVTPIWRGFKGRKREHPPAVTFDDVTGWRVAQYGDARAVLVRSEEEPCYEDLRYQAKITYHSEGGSGHFELVPPEPVPISGRFNAACAWVYGNNWDWVPDPTTPQVRIWVRLADAAGQRHRICLGVVNFKFYGFLHKRLRDDPRGDPNHLYWGGPADGKIHPPARLEAIEVHGGTNPEPRTIYIESVAFYQDDMHPPAFRPELIENLPFPTTPDTILPTLAQPTTVELVRDGDSYLFTAQGDERVVWRYTPRTGTLSDLVVEIAGRPPFSPCAGAGPAVLLGGEERELTCPDLTRELLGVSDDGERVTTRWRFSLGGESFEFTLSLRAKGKSLIAEWASNDAKATALRLGRVEGLRSPRLFRVPYLSIYNAGPHVLLEGDTFLLTLLDWYNTESSAFYVAHGVEGGAATLNGGACYFPLTDGTRNPLGERQFINVSSRFEEVLPSIPNPPSTQAAVLREYLYCHIGGTGPDRFDRYLKLWRRFHRYGIEKVRVSHHEDAWTDGADVGQGPQEYTMCREAAPEVGDEKLIAYCRAMREMGYYIGLYENFTDYNPLGKSWDERNCARNSWGELIRVWPPTYAIRPLKALEMALYYPREVARKFGTNTAYRDCHTAYPPWGQVDYQAGTPGAGKFATNFKAWGALLMDGHRAYGSPIFSEGGHHFFFAGLVDGNYAQMGIPDAPNHPLLLEFDLLRLHPLEADISMIPGWVWGHGLYDCQAHTIAYGHIGFLPFTDLAEAGRYYYTMQQLQYRYVMVPVREILYHKGGRYMDITQALKTGANAAKQVVVRYANGLEVAVNCNPQERWVVELGGKQYDLSPFGWAARDGQGFEEYSTEIEGARVNFVRSPEYLFADGGGQWRDFGPVATDGAVAVRKTPRGGPEVLVISKPTRLAIEAGEGAQVEALDEDESPLGAPAVVREGRRLVFSHVEGAASYLIR